MIIVLHAPPDQEIKTIDEILNYAIQPGILPHRIFQKVTANSFPRVPHLLSHGSGVRCGYDIPSGSEVWEEESPNLLVDLFNSRFCLRHVGQGFWNCCEVDAGGQQPVHASINVCVHHLDCGLYLDPDELFQQGSEPVSHINVRDGSARTQLTLLIFAQSQPPLLRYFYYRYSLRFVHLIRRLQHIRCC